MGGSAPAAKHRCIQQQMIFCLCAISAPAGSMGGGWTFLHASAYDLSSLCGRSGQQHGRQRAGRLHGRRLR